MRVPNKASELISKLDSESLKKWIDLFLPQNQSESLVNSSNSIKLSIDSEIIIKMVSDVKKSVLEIKGVSIVENII